MESQQWPTKYQQSVATGLESTDDSLNNGNGKTADKAAETTDAHETNGNDDAENNTENRFETTTENQPVSTSISDRAKQILEHMNSLSNTEKYLLYLKFFQLTNVVDPLRQPLNPLGSRIEIRSTISWIRTHLEENPEISLPKQQVYNEYSTYCVQKQIKPLSQADFGKVMKQVYPKVRARRLGTRGHSRYCYSGLQRCKKLDSPTLPDLADKPLSTEAPCTQSSLTAAAWLIVKEWSEQHFGVGFASLQALACYLVITFSIGVGTEAANQVTSAANSQQKDSSGGKCGLKHREMQLQLQKKIHQKNEVKERKRKMQSPKNEQKQPNGKKTKQSSTSARSETSPILTSTGENSTGTSTSTGTGSTCTSPTQGKPICDKSLDFTQIPTLPVFESFQKPIGDQQNTSSSTSNSPSGGGGGSGGGVGSNSTAGIGTTVAKVPIPRLSSVPKTTQHSPQSSPRKQIKNAKYKAIQPKPQPCDIASYNPHIAADIRSQGVHNVDRFKERKCSDDDCDAPDFPLTRERFDSVSNVDKDAMDEYLGTNNSQHEEELSKYFSNNITDAVDQDNNNKLSQLRHLLEQNGISDNKAIVFNVIGNSSGILQEVNSSLINTAVNRMPIHSANSYVAQIQTVNNNLQQVPESSNSTRRRVSFETPIQHEDTVPPSPNTRRKNFSFTPISPGPQSPNGGRQSKCSSTNVSPFVSPRNTPVPRTKNNTHQNAGIMIAANLTNINKKQSPHQQPNLSIKVKREPDLTLEIPSTEKDSLIYTKNYMPMSAPASPMLNNNKSVLQKLLNSNSKVAYTPDYVNPLKSDNQDEICELFKTEIPDEIVTSFTSYRSQSVPLSQMGKSEFPVEFTVAPPQNPADFNDLDPIAETSATVGRIIEALDEPSDCSNIDMYVDMNDTSTQCLSTFNLIINNNTDVQTNFVQDEITFSGPEQQAPTRSLNRSQSIDVNGCYEIKCNNPSRSVPSTPLPFQTNPSINKHNQSMKNFNHSSRSYPSTPLLINETPFNYNITNGDCLLNGQPIRSNGTATIAEQELASNLTYFIPNLNDMNGDNNIETHLTQDEFNSLPSNDFGIVVENENVLMDENGVLIGSEQNYAN